MARKYDNFFRTALTAPLLIGETTWSLGTDPTALSPGDTYRLQLAQYTTVNGVQTLTKTELVDIDDTGTLTRGVEGTTEHDWSIGAYVQIVPTAESFASGDLSNYLQKSGDTLTDGTIQEYTETINASAGATLDRSTGGIQRLNLTANTTLDLSDLVAGQSVMYRVTGGTTYTLGYTGLGAWSDGNTPTLSATHYLEFVHDGVEVVGFDCRGR